MIRKWNRTAFVTSATISLFLLLSPVAPFAGDALTVVDLQAIGEVLDDLGRAIEGESLASILSLCSPNMEEEEYRGIKSVMSKKLRENDYQTYEFVAPRMKDLTVVEEGGRVKFSTGYEQEYTCGENCSRATSGMSAHFVMEKVGGRWMILETDFHEPERGVMLFAALSIGMLVLVIGGSIALFIFWLWMLIDCLKRDFSTPVDKVVWVLLLLFASVIGMTIYYFAVKRKDRRK